MILFFQDNEKDAERKPQADFSQNRDLKYLTSALNNQPDNESRALLYLNYVSCCRFNTKFNPRAIIKFTEQDVQHLGLWTAAQQNETNQHDQFPEVREWLLNVLSIQAVSSGPNLQINYEIICCKILFVLTMTTKKWQTLKAWNTGLIKIVACTVLIRNLHGSLKYL